MLIRIFVPLAFAAVSTILPTLTQAQVLSFREAEANSSLAGRASLDKNFYRYQVATLVRRGPELSSESQFVSIELPGKSTLQFRGKHNTMADRADVIERSRFQTRRRRIAQAIHFNGIADGRRISLSYGDGLVLCAIESDNRKYFIEPLRRYDPGASESLFVIYEHDDVKSSDGYCGNAVADVGAQSANAAIQADALIGVTATARIVDVAVAADYSMYVNHGASLSNVTTYLTAIYNMVQNLYHGNFNYDLTMNISEIVVFTSAAQNPWPSTDNMDVHFSNFTTWGQSGFTRPFDISQYWFFTINFGGGVAGRAWQPNYCTPQGNSVIREHAVSMISMSAIVAHEMAHNFGAPHDANGSPTIMAPVNSTSLFWSSTTRDYVNTALSVTSCINAPGVLVAPDNTALACPGTPVSFTAVVSVTQGSNPVYQWKVNGLNVGTNSDHFTSSTLAPGDFISCTFTSTVGGIPQSTLSNAALSPVPPAPLIQGPTSISICEGSPGITLVSNIGVAAQWYRDGAIIPGAINSSYVASLTGNYTVKVALTGCESAASVAVFVGVYPTEAPTLRSSGTVICAGGDVTLSTSMPGKFFTFYKNGVSMGVQQNASITVNEAATYTVRTECSVALSNAIVVTAGTTPPMPHITAGGATTFCFGQSVMLTSNAASGNQWYKATTVNSVTTTIAIVGATSPTLVATEKAIYSVRVTGGGCTSQSDNAIIVNVHPVPQLTLSVFEPTTTCAGTPVPIFANGGETMRWFKNGVLMNGETSTLHMASTSGNYTATWTVLGCESPLSNQITITVKPVPPTPVISTTGSLNVCSGEIVGLNSNAATGNQWYNHGAPIVGSVGTSLPVSSTGSYSVISTINGCASPVSNVVNVVVAAPVQPPTLFAPGGNEACGSVLILMGNGYAENQWFRDGTLISETSTAHVAATSGAYTVKTKLNNCYSLPSVPLNVSVKPIPPAPVVSAPATSFCNGGSITISSSAVSGNQWYADGTPIVGETSNTFVTKEPGSFAVRSVVNGCASPSSNTLKLTKVLVETPVIQAQGSTAICSGFVDLTASAASGYRWYKDGSEVVGFNGVIFPASESGAYSLRTFEGECVSGISNVVNVSVGALQPAPVISPAGSISACQGTVTLSSSVSTSGNQWYRDGFPILGASSPIIVVSQTGYYTVKFSVGQCVSEQSSPVSVTILTTPSAPTITSSGSTVCNGSSVTLTSSATEALEWLRDGAVIPGKNNPTLVVDQAGSYQVRTGNPICMSSLSNPAVVTQSPQPSPAITASGPLSFCQGLFVTLSCAPGNNIQWYKDGTAIAGSTDTSLTAQASGRYKVIMGTGSCASPSPEIAVTVNPIPNQPTITSDGLDLISSADNGNQWFGDGIAITGATTKRYRPSNSGQYSVRVLLEGCVGTLSQPFPFVLTGLEEDAMETIQVYPNPASEFVVVDGLTAGMTVSVYDLAGRQLSKTTGKDGTARLDVSEWAHGIFVIVISDEFNNIVVRRTATTGER